MVANAGWANLIAAQDHRNHWLVAHPLYPLVDRCRFLKRSTAAQIEHDQEALTVPHVEIAHCRILQTITALGYFVGLHCGDFKGDKQMASICLPYLFLPSRVKQLEKTGLSIILAV